MKFKRSFVPQHLLVNKKWVSDCGYYRIELWDAGYAAKYSTLDDNHSMFSNRGTRIGAGSTFMKARQACVEHEQKKFLEVL